MFKRTSDPNELKRKWMYILFLVLFVAAMFCMTGIGQHSLNQTKVVNPQKPVIKQAPTYVEPQIPLKRIIHIKPVPTYILSFE
jgi:ABC-type oligopeptide transport system substrate-binding subunit